MKTTYFWKALHEPVNGQTYINIVTFQPKYCNFESYPALFPSRSLIEYVKRNGYTEKVYGDYRKEYRNQLLDLDARTVYEDLKGCTICCYEPSKSLAENKKFCHRRLVAGWIELELGIIVPEELRDNDRGLYIPALY